jgi:hypothetical protein
MSVTPVRGCYLGQECELLLVLWYSLEMHAIAICLCYKPSLAVVIHNNIDRTLTGYSTM